jgi:hypothetical protein
MDSKGLRELCTKITQAFATLRSQYGLNTKIESDLATAYQSLCTSVGIDSDPSKADFDPLQPAVKAELGVRLSSLQRTLEDMLLDGPNDAKSVMYKAYASNSWIYALGTVALIGFIGILVTIVMRWDRALTGIPPLESTSPDQGAPRSTASLENLIVRVAVAQATPAPSQLLPDATTLGPGQTQQFRVTNVQQGQAVVWVEPATGIITQEGLYTAPASLAGLQTIRIVARIGNSEFRSTVRLTPPSGPPEKEILFMVVLMGALGGFVRFIGSFTIFVGNRQLMRSWIAYYLLMPVQGAGLALILYLILRLGLLSPSASSGNTAALNLVGVYGLAALTGLFSQQALEMLREVFAAIFKRVEAKDSAKTTKPEASATS